MNALGTHITLQNDRLVVTGDLNFATVMDLWEQSLPLLAQCQRLDFDLSKVVSSNSAGLALMIEWIKQAKHSNKAITFYSLPRQLASIASVSGIAGMFDSQ
jgi:phospholipid transport system transporter-binding protein